MANKNGKNGSPFLNSSKDLSLLPIEDERIAYRLDTNHNPKNKSEREF